MKNKMEHNWNSLYIELTSRCNLHCKYCYNDSSMECTESLPLNMAKQLINQATERNIRDISFSGGEPLLYPHFAELFDFTTAICGRQVTLITNASLLNLDLLDRIVATRSLLQLTLDGHTPELHGQTRESKNFKQNLKVIQYLRLKYQYEGIYIRINVSYHNFSFVSNTVEMLYDLGIRNITIAIISTMGRGRICNQQNNIYDKSSLNELELTTKLIQKKYPDLRLKYYAFGQCLGCDFYSETGYTMNLRIRYDGAIFPCQSFNSNGYILGNIKEIDITKNEFEDLFDNWVEEAKADKEEYLRTHCRSCYCRPFCQGGCMAYILDDPSEHIMFNASCEMRKTYYKSKLLKASH